MNDIVSVIIPCYNCEHTLRRCLNSVLMQTYKNIQLIVVNDGSIDKTKEIALSYSNKFSDFIFIDLVNGGVSRARNRGLEKATGRYIQFLDSDDNFTRNDAIEKAVRLLNHYGVDIVAYNFTHPCFETHLASGIYNLNDERDLLAYYQDFFVMNLPWNKLFKREVITTPFPDGVAFAEDEIFNYSNLKNVNKVYFTEEVFYNYYCAKPRKKGRVSAINQTLANGNFLKSKQTIWYKGLNNELARKEIGEKNYPQHSDYFRAVRIFDFFFWNLQFLCSAHIDERSIAKECQRIANEREFIWALKIKERFGINAFVDLSENAFPIFLNFARESIRVFEQVKRQKKGTNIYFSLMRVFAKYFLYFDRKTLDLTDDCAKAVAFSGIRPYENFTLYLPNEALV